MENRLPWYEMTADQRRIHIDTAQLHSAYVDASNKNRSYRGGMHWKTAKGRQYLFRSMDRQGYGKSLGVRSPETEAIFRDFHENKKRIRESIHELQNRLRDQTRFCKAARIARVPRVVGSILRLFETKKLLGSGFQVIGTNALYAYEASAGIFFESGLMATRDVDILWDTRSRLQLHSRVKAEPGGLLAILQEADPSFELVRKRSFRAMNQKGYMVDLLKPEPRPPHLLEKRQMGASGDLVAEEIPNLQWLVSSPKLTQCVICDDGYPAVMVVPDPRAFSLHKLWLSRQADREPIKRRRDKEQALAVCRLVLHYLPHLQFSPAELRMFPKAVVTTAAEAIKASGLPPDYGFRS